MTAFTPRYADYPETSQEAVNLLMQQWPTTAADLLARDGKDPRHPGGHNIAGDRQLTQTINDIARGYFELFYEQANEISKRNRRDDRNRDARENVHRKTTLYTRDSCKRLVQEGHMDVKDACNLIGSIIRRCVTTHGQLFGGGVEVMNSALNHIERHCTPSR